MANADGSIRIEATVSDEQAKKQIAQMSKDIEKQTAAVERQAEKVKKLAAQWEKVSSGGARGLKMKTDLEATEAEAKKLAQQLEEVNAKAYSAQAEYSEKLKQAAVGAIPQEEFSESAQKVECPYRRIGPPRRGIEKKRMKKPRSFVKRWQKRLRAHGTARLGRILRVICPMSRSSLRTCARGCNSQKLNFPTSRIR